MPRMKADRWTTSFNEARADQPGKSWRGPIEHDGALMCRASMRPGQISPGNDENPRQLRFTEMHRRFNEARADQPGKSITMRGNANRLWNRP